MTKKDSDTSSVSSSFSIYSENYRQLLNVFKETHEEANKLALSNNWLKGFVRMDGFKLEGGELFKEGFRKLLSQE